MMSQHTQSQSSFYLFPSETCIITPTWKGLLIHIPLIYNSCSKDYSSSSEIFQKFI